MATQKKIIGKLPVFRGEYNKDVVYYKHNIVTYLGSSFISTKDENMSAPCTVGDKEFILSNGWEFFSDSSEAYFMDERFDEMAEVTVTTDDEDEVNDVESDIVNEAIRKTPQTLSKAEQAQARANIGAASLEESNAFKAEVEEQVVSIDAKVSDIGSEVGLLNFEKGSITEFGGLSSETNRVRSGFVSAPFKLEVNEEYYILRINAYDKTFGFVKEYYHYSEQTPSPTIIDDSYYYRIVVKKRDETVFDLSEDFIKSYKNLSSYNIEALRGLSVVCSNVEVRYINGKLILSENPFLYSTCASGRAKLLNDDESLEIDMAEENTILYFDVELMTRARAQSLNIGKSNLKVSVWTKNEDLSGKVILAFKLFDSVSNVGVLGQYYQITKSKDERDSIANEILNVGNSGLVTPKFFNGSISSDGVIESYYTYRVYSSVFKAPFSIELEDDFRIFRIAKYDSNGQFAEAINIPYSKRYEFKEDGLCRICILSFSNTDFLPTDHFIKNFSNGLIKELKDTDKNLRNELLEEKGKNRINPKDIDYRFRYSVAGTRIINVDEYKIVSSGLIEVKEGEWYTISGDGIFVNVTPQGGYFAESAVNEQGQAAIQSISFVKPVTGYGMTFQVPIGLGVKYVVINLNSNDDFTAVNGLAQLEEGEMATEYSDYELKLGIRKELLPQSFVAVAEQDELSKYTSFGNLRYEGASDKFPKFRKHWILKDKDLVVVNTGTSLTARSGEHCTIKEDAPYRPPLMHSNNFASHVWDDIAWEGQEYRRYDAKSEKDGSVAMFTETGTFQTQSNMSEWDDGSYRQGFTRFADSGGSISYIIPSDAKRCNFIYRTDSIGSESCIVSVAEGDGFMQVMNDEGIWTEANGYQFSMRESVPTTIGPITFIDPVTRKEKTYSSIQTKGNTTYQKRLNMRAVSVGSTKGITISGASGRFMYWGVEWSKRPYMITYINAARGSHNSTISQNELSLIRYQDNEIWGFKPDLIFSEDPITNSGAGGKLSSSYSSFSWGIITDNFFMADNGVSMKSRCETLGLEVPEMVLFNSTLAWSFGAFDESGKLFIVDMNDGIAMTTLDAQMSCYQYMTDKYPNITYLNAIKNWVNAAIACYGNLHDATIGSGKDGLTFTNEGGHWNDTGSKVMARFILPVLDFIN